MKERVNAGLLLRNILEYLKAGVTVEASYYYSSRGGAPPQSIVLRAGRGVSVGGKGLEAFTNNGYKLSSLKADENGNLVILFERRYVK